MYTITLGDSETHDKVLEKVVQFGWWGTLTSTSPSQLVELGMDQITNQGDFWMNMISNNDWVSRMVLMIRLFLQTLCKYSFMLS